jgi:hypothetical protein
MWLERQASRTDEVGELARIWKSQSVQNQKSDFAAWLIKINRNELRRSVIMNILAEYGNAVESYSTERRHRIPEIIKADWYSELMRVRFAYHRSHSSISADEYYRTRRRILFKEIEHRKIIYLDMLHWINLRHIILSDKRARPIYREALCILFNLSEEQKIFCPISVSIFNELTKQTDSKTRVATARLMDAFGNGIAFQHIDKILAIEFRCFALQQLFGSSGVSPKEWIWVKGMNLWQEGWPVIPGYNADENTLLQKVMIDLAWETPIEALVDEGLPSGFTEWEDLLAAATNVDADWYRDSGLQFEEIRQREKAFWYQRKIKEFQKITSEIGNEYPNEVRRSMESGAPKSIYDPMILPSLQIVASATAALLSIKTKKFSSHDIFDLQHAAVALPYCDALFCDRPMAHLLTQRPLALTSVYRATVGCTGEELVAYLRSI